MAAINDLIERISDPALKARLLQEVAKLQKSKKFGLVFEEHLPECAQLPDVPIRKGSFVSLKDDTPNHAWRVLEINGDNARCEKQDDSHEINDLALSSLVCVTQFGNPIYPFLKSIDKIKNAPDSDLWHTLIEADNYHALQLLVYLYAGKVDCIYIDPPYNTGAKDWKYNNDYVDSNDSYRHSKWLSMMKKRLELSKKLLNPKDSVLIVTIDEKEYLHLGCLLEQMFPEAKIQMISTIIKPEGTNRTNEFSRTNEYIYFIMLGSFNLYLSKQTMFDETEELMETTTPIKWRNLRRREKTSIRTARPNQFYPIFINQETKMIQSIGDALTPDVNRFSIPIPDNCFALFPLSGNGTEMLWGKEYGSARILLQKGYLKAKLGKTKDKTLIYYLPEGVVTDIETGKIIVTGRGKQNEIEGYYFTDEVVSLPKTIWNVPSHNAQTNGSLLLKKVIGENRFDFPKSLYAVHDTIRFFVANKPNALILDFFAGSGTTLHAVNLLNKEDGGNRRCIMVTNNEIGEPKERELQPLGLKPGDEEWEKWGIARYVNWPRTKCSISGIDIEGNPISGDYITTNSEVKYVDRNYVQLDYLVSPMSFIQKKRLLILLNKGKAFKFPTLTSDVPFLVSDEDKCNASILFDPEMSEEWIQTMDGMNNITDLFIVTPNKSQFSEIKSEAEAFLGSIEKNVPMVFPMASGFKTNVEFFKLGFLDKTCVSLGRQFKEMLPILWMKTGAIGECPELSEEIPNMLLLPQNHFAILVKESYFSEFKDQLENLHQIDTVYIVTDSESAYQNMISQIKVKYTYQLYKDYLDNFRINLSR